MSLFTSEANYTGGMLSPHQEKVRNIISNASKDESKNYSHKRNSYAISPDLISLNQDLNPDQNPY
jgi:hypothetical protein